MTTVEATVPAVAHRPFDESPPIGVLAPAEGGDERDDRAAARFLELSAAVARNAADAIVSIDPPDPELRAAVTAIDFFFDVISSFTALRIRVESSRSRLRSWAGDSS